MRYVAAKAEERGVFGVPTFVLDDTGELFWGTDRVCRRRFGTSDGDQAVRAAGGKTSCPTCASTPTPTSTKRMTLYYLRDGMVVGL